MLPRNVRTPAALRAAREALGLSADGLAKMVRVDDGRTVRRWESGEREIPGPVSVLLETAMNFLDQKISLTQQLERLNSGEMTAGYFTWGNQRIDPTDQNVAAVQEGIKSLTDALVTLTRQPPDSESRREVHFYHLQRLTPLFDPLQKDRWPMPGEINVLSALTYFEKDTGFGPLEICDVDEPGAEFLLEQRVALRRQVGASLRTQPGELIQQFYVRRVPAA